MCTESSALHTNQVIFEIDIVVFKKVSNSLLALVIFYTNITT